MKKINTNEWVTVQDCIGIPGFPSGAANVRKKLELLATGNPEAKRKREGIKGYQYHISILPELSRAFFGWEQGSADAQPERSNEGMHTDEGAFWWEAIYKALSDNEIDLIIDTFKNKGKTGIFSANLLAMSDVDISSVSRAALQTAQVLQALPEAELKEILSRYGLSTQDFPVANKREPHKKAG